MVKAAVFSLTHRRCLYYKNYDLPEGGPVVQDDAVPARLLQLNALLLDAAGGRDVPDTPKAGGPRGSGASGSGEVFLGGGAKRSNLGPGAKAQVAARHWQQGDETWSFVGEEGLGLMVALALPHTWDGDTASALARAFRDEVVAKHRQRLLPGPGPPPPLPADVSGLLMGQALRAVRRLAGEAVEAVRGWQPAWVYFVAAASLMGDYRDPAQARAARQHSQLPGGGDKGGPSGKGGGGGRRGGLLGCFGGGAADQVDDAGGGGGGGRDQGGAATQGRPPRLSQAGGGQGGGGEPPPEHVLPPGSIGPLQHLVLCEGNDGGGGGRRSYWDPPSIAAAVLQVKPPPRASAAQQGVALPQSQPALVRGAGPVGAPDPSPSYPDLEDVELEMELQPPAGFDGAGPGPSTSAAGGGGGGGKRMFSVVGVRVDSAVAVVAVPALASHSAGKASCLRLELSPYLTPMSGLFGLLAAHAGAYDLLVLNALVRLLE